MRRLQPGLVLGAMVLVCACGAGTVEGGGSDGARPDGGAAGDGGVQPPDAGPADAGALDAGESDAGCTPRDCTAQGLACGPATDGCGTALDCGGCGTGEVCSGGQCGVAPVDCSAIDASASYELCESGADFCAGVFTDGSGCAAFCAAAGLVCRSRSGGEPGCLEEPANVIPCDAVNGHASDWCVCEADGGVVDPDCSADPLDPPTRSELYYRSAVFQPRSSWVLDCRDYAYTAQFAEHEACDSLYQSGSGRGTATFTFSVSRGRYDVFVEGRHTTNRNPSGMLVRVQSSGDTWSTRIDQRDDAGVVMDPAGSGCLDGTVEVIIDSTESGASDSVRTVVLSPQ